LKISASEVQEFTTDACNYIIRSFIICTLYGMDDRRVGVRNPVEARLLSTSSRPVLGPTQPPIEWAPVIKWPRREADLSPPVSAEVKNIVTCSMCETIEGVFENWIY
jgi:hypothetical protein